MKKVAVEQGLSMIASYLSDQGYSVEVLGGDLESNTSKCDSCDAVVVAGYNSNMMGFSDTSTKVPVINAEGLTPEEVKRMIDQQSKK